jgi:hypothetical protein
MRTMEARNVNEVFPVVMNIWFRSLHLLRDIAPRGMRTLELREPVAITYRHPEERVLFDPVRDANPFFHLFESLWILAGRDDVAFLRRLVPRMADYSDDGRVFHGAYGVRLNRNEQFGAAIEELLGDPATRRAVVALWVPDLDAGYAGKDMPCNCMLFFKLREGELSLTVANRSNDAVWGAYGANVVQFSMIQEYVAATLGARLGSYTQISDSLHIYPDNTPTDKLLALGASYSNPYMDGAPPVKAQPLLADGEHIGDWEEDLQAFFAFVDDNEPLMSDTFSTRWWRGVALPMWAAFCNYKEENLPMAVNCAAACTATDWGTAAVLWLQRRQAAREGAL